MAGSADDDVDLAGRLIERLLVDPEFRAEFRRDPSGACVALGLPGLAAELGGSGKAMHTMELRESRSSLAGVVMAIAAEGIALEQVERLASHGLPGGLGKALHGVKLPKEARGLGKASPASLEHKLEHKAGVSPASVKGLEKATGHGAGAAGAGAAGAGAAGGSSSGATGAPGGGGGAGAGASAGSGSGSGAGGAAAAGSGGGGGSAATAGSGGGAGGGAAASHAASSGGGGGGGGGSGSGHSGSSGGASASSRSAPNMGGGNPATSASASSSSASGAGWPDQTPSASSSASTVPAGSGAASTVPAGGGAASTVPAGSGAASTVPAGSGAASTVPAGGGAASTVPAGGGGVGTVASSAGTGGTVSGAVEGATNAAGGTGVAPIGVTGLLDSPNFTAPPAVRTWLESGGVDPRVVSMLDSVLAHHTIGVSNLEVLSSPVHVQSFDIVSVDGQPVGPDNFAARDLVTEIAAMDPTTRPDEIGTPWPIQSPGFFSNPTSANGLHLAFEMPGTNATPAQDAGYSGIDTGQPQPQMNYAIGAQPTAGAAGYGGGVQEQVAQAGGAGQTPMAGSAAGAQQAVAGSAPAGQQSVVESTTAGSGSGATTTPGSGAEAVASATPGSTGAGDPNFASPKAHEAFESAKKELGTPYQWGGSSPQTGFDCSGLMQWAYHQAGVNLPRVADEQFNVGTPVTINNLREGDLVFFRIGGGDVDHVGMYVGNNQFLEAPRTGEDVQYANLNDPYWKSQFAGARRIVPLDPGGGGAQNISAGSGSAAAGAGSSTPATAGAGTPATGTPAGAVPGTPATAVPGAPATAVPGAPVGAGPGGPAEAVPGTGAPGAGAPIAGAPGAGAPAPGGPGTAAFKAVAPHDHGPPRHTVQFLQAVQPSSGTPAPAEAAPPGGQVPVEQVAGTSPGAVPETTVPATPGAGGAAEQVVGQGPGVLPVGGAISVSSSLLTNGQETFAAHLAQLTGLSPRVVAAWELAEESGGPAQARQAASNFNWLNIGYFDSGPGQMAFNNAFSDPVTAAEQSAKFLKGDWGGASASIRAILSTVGQSPQQQMSAIANSDWASSHYYGGSSLRGTFDELADMKVESAGANSV
jgi:cell wall-associated NlpC family hydrolase